MAAYDLNFGKQESSSKSISINEHQRTEAEFSVNRMIF